MRSHAAWRSFCAFAMFCMASIGRSVPVGSDPSGSGLSDAVCLDLVGLCAEKVRAGAGRRLGLPFGSPGPVGPGWRAKQAFPCSVALLLRFRGALPCSVALLLRFRGNPEQ